MACFSKLKQLYYRINNPLIHTQHNHLELFTITCAKQQMAYRMLEEKVHVIIFDSYLFNSYDLNATNNGSNLGAPYVVVNRRPNVVVYTLIRILLENHYIEVQHLISADVKMKTIATSDSKKFANENIALGMKHLERFITWIQ